MLRYTRLYGKLHLCNKYHRSKVLDSFRMNGPSSSFPCVATRLLPSRFGAKGPWSIKTPGLRIIYSRFNLHIVSSLVSFTYAVSRAGGDKKSGYGAR